MLRKHTMYFSTAEGVVGLEYDREKNADRVRWGQVAFDAHTRVTKGASNDDETQLSDLLGDLQHWAHANGVDFDEALRRGTTFYIEESHPARWRQRIRTTGIAACAIGIA